MFQFFSLKRSNIFIHIPKVGGSTFVGLLKESVKTSKEERSKPTHLTELVGHTHIKHVDFYRVDRRFKMPEIFTGSSATSFSKKNIFMLTRDPADRLQSEFNFQYHVLDGKRGSSKAAILSRLSSLPKNLMAYANNKETQDYQCKFLLGRKIADPEPITEDEFESIVHAIESLPIHCGTTDEYGAFLNLFQEVSGLSLKPEMVIRKKTPKEFHKQLSDSQRKKIYELNKFDLRLFNYVKSINQGKVFKSVKDFRFRQNEDFTV